MRRFAELTAFAATAVFLIATSQARNPCATETINLAASTTCGPPANLVVSSNTGCGVTATGADFGNLPTGGSIDSSGVDAGLLSGFSLRGARGDAGTQSCLVTPADGGFSIVCSPSCLDPDAGCPEVCSGMLTPP